MYCNKIRDIVVKIKNTAINHSYCRDFENIYLHLSLIQSVKPLIQSD